MLGIRSDALPYEPVGVGPPWSSGDNHFVSGRKPMIVNDDVQVTDIVTSIDQVTYSYLALITYLMVGLLTLNTIRGRSRKRLKRVFKAIIYKLWSVFILIFDQEYYVSKLWPNRILWTHFCIAYFLLVFGYFWSLLSTDLVTTIQPIELHSISDLFSKEFNQVQPVIFKSLAIYSLLREAKANTKLNHLYNRLQVNVSVSLLTVDASEQQDTSRIIATLLNVLRGSDDLTLITTKHYWTAAVKPGACMMKPEYASNGYISKGSFAEGIATSFYNKLTDNELKRYFNRLLGSFFEMNFFVEQTKAYVVETAAKYGLSYDWNAMVCSGEYRDDDFADSDTIKLSLSTLRMLFLTIFYCILLATIVCAIEKCLNHCSVKSSRRGNITTTHSFNR